VHAAIPEIEGLLKEMESAQSINESMAYEGQIKQSYYQTLTQ